METLQILLQTLLTLGALTLTWAEVKLLTSPDVKRICLSAHNKLRHLHPKTEPLVYDDTLAKHAGEWAIHLAKKNKIFHASAEIRDGEGENLYIKKSNVIASAAEGVKSWYDEEPLYDYEANKFQYPAGHFTAMVWRKTKKVGCAVAINKRGDKISTIVVSRYLPMGNMQGQFTKMVLHQKEGVNIPTKYELDPSICKDRYPLKTCKYFKNKCGTKMVDGACPKFCGIC